MLRLSEGLCIYLYRLWLERYSDTVGRGVKFPSMQPESLILYLSVNLSLGFDVWSFQYAAFYLHTSSEQVFLHNPELNVSSSSMFRFGSTNLPLRKDVSFVVR
jgi:hypothetical protein